MESKTYKDAGVDLIAAANIKEKIQIELWQSKSQKNSLITEIIQSQLKQIMYIYY